MNSSKFALLMNRYFQMLVLSAKKHNAILTETNGDRAIINFGVPYTSPDDARHALDCALSIQKGIEDLNRKTDELGLPAIMVSIGVATGHGLCGAIGPTNLKRYAVIGRKLIIFDNVFRTCGSCN